MPLPVLIGVGAALIRGGLTAATLAPLVKPAIGMAKRFVQKGTVRPGIGSPVTKGPLKLGKQTLIGPKPTHALRIASAVGVGGVGVATLKASRTSTGASPAPAPRRSTPAAKATSTKDKKCCPAGTKRMVCFKKDVDEVAETKRREKKRKAKARAIKRGRKSARGVSAKQKAARARFAKAARKGPIRKGTRL
jgi:hypothetical protein